MNLVKVARVTETAVFDVAGNRITNGGLKDLKVGQFVAFREQVVTQGRNAAGELIALEPAAYWNNKIATAAFDNMTDAIEAVKATELMEIEAAGYLMSKKAELGAKLKGIKMPEGISLTELMAAI